jgi:MFS family permease
VVGVFTLGASADSFLLLRIGDLGLASAWVPIVWLSLNAAKAATNVPGGRLADRIGRRRALVAAWIVYGAAYAAFPLTQSIALTWALIVAYGTYYGLAEGAEKALVADLAPTEVRGRAFGIFHGITGIAILPANAIFGALYGAGATGTAFAIGAVAAFSAALGLVTIVRPGPTRTAGKAS